MAYPRRPDQADRLPPPAAAGRQAGRTWRPAGALADDTDAAGRDQLWAAACYLSVPVLSFAAPLAVLVASSRSRTPSAGLLRQHAHQALNLSVTLLLYNLSALILAAMLALDTLSAVLLIVVPALVLLWLATLGYLAQAARAARRGEFYRIPAWLCATIIRRRAAGPA